jgi:hypothetical protein
MKLSEIADAGLEEGWVSNIPELEGVRLKCRPSGNNDWRRMAQTLINAVPRKKRTPSLDPEEMDRINVILIRECGLLDWEGIEADDGQPLPYDKKKASEFLTKSQRFRDGALYACGQVAEGTVEEVEITSGN